MAKAKGNKLPKAKMAPNLPPGNNGKAPKGGAAGQTAGKAPKAPKGK